VYQQRLERRVDEQAADLARRDEPEPGAGPVALPASAAPVAGGTGELGRVEAVQRVAARLAHDLNNVLAAITSYATLAAEGLPPDAEARADLAEIVVAAEQGARWTRQLLELGSVHGGHLDLPGLEGDRAPRRTTSPG
jgi:hypothetical protein